MERERDVKKLLCDMTRLGITLMIVCAVAATGLAATYAVTWPVIQEQQRRKVLEENKELLKLFPGFQGDLTEKKELLEEARKEFGDLESIFELMSAGKRVGVAIKLASRGYGGPIKIAVGIDTEGKVAGVLVLDVSGETAGVGSKVAEAEGAPFREQFKGKTAADALRVGKDVDAISGATISSRGVASGVKNALVVYESYLKGG
ncbi:MAG TPA: hypothetical protein DCW86_03145 [Actinobacteria bacterium]|nr:hypothetical protein [Actinomycetota bacterium]